MPSVSKKQHNLMALVANDPKTAKRLGIKQSVGKEFMSADKGKKFKGGGMMDKKDLKQDKMLIKKAFKQHDMQEHKGGKGTKLELKKGGKVKKMAMGGMMGNAINAVSNAIANMPKTTTSAAAPSRPTGGIAPNIKSQLPARTGPVVTTGSAYNSKKPRTPFKEGGVAKTVTKEMEYDYKTGKKSFAGSTAKKDAHAEKEGKIVAKHAAYDKAMGMKKGGSCKGYSKGGQLSKANGIAVRGKSKGRII